ARGRRVPRAHAPGGVLPARRLLGAVRRDLADRGLVPPARRDARRRDPGRHLLRGRRPSGAPVPIRGRGADPRRGRAQAEAEIAVVPYHPAEIEPRWQAWWHENKTFRTPDGGAKPKYYVLDMFPYPSGAGLHVGHPE